MSLLSFLAALRSRSRIGGATSRASRIALGTLALTASLATSPPRYWHVTSEAPLVLPLSLAPGESISLDMVVRVEGHRELRAGDLLLFTCVMPDTPDAAALPTPPAPGPVVIDGVDATTSRYGPGLTDCTWTYSGYYGGSDLVGQLDLAARCRATDPCDLPTTVTLLGADSPWSGRLRIEAHVRGDEQGEPPPGRVSVLAGSVAP